MWSAQVPVPAAKTGTPLYSHHSMPTWSLWAFSGTVTPVRGATSRTATNFSLKLTAWQYVRVMILWHSACASGQIWTRSQKWLSKLLEETHTDSCYTPGHQLSPSAANFWKLKETSPHAHCGFPSWASTPCHPWKGNREKGRKGEMGRRREERHASR